MPVGAALSQQAHGNGDIRICPVLGEIPLYLMITGRLLAMLLYPVGFGDNVLPDRQQQSADRCIEAY
jgi:hypothetical protein